MSRVCGIAQRTNGVKIYRIIPLFTIESLDHERHTGVKSRYLVGYTALVNCDVLQISGLLSSEETGQRALGINALPLSTTSVNCLSNTNHNSQNERPVPPPHQPITQSSNVPYSPTRGLPYKCISVMMREDKSCPGCHFNHPNNPSKLKLHQEVGCPEFAKHGYILWKDVTALAKIVDKFTTKFPRNTD